eukprot:gene12818-15042_t
MTASDDREVKSSVFNEHLEALIDNNYPNDSKTLLDVVITTFLIFRPEYIHAVIKQLAHLVQANHLIYKSKSPPFYSLNDIFNENSSSMALATKYQGSGGGGTSKFYSKKNQQQAPQQTQPTPFQTLTTLDEFVKQQQTTITKEAVYRAIRHHIIALFLDNQKKPTKLQPMVQIILPHLVHFHSQYLDTDYFELVNHYFLNSSKNHFLHPILQCMGEEIPEASAIMKEIINSQRLNILLFGKNHGFGANGHFTNTQLYEGVRSIENLIRILETHSSDIQNAVFVMWERYWMDTLPQTANITSLYYHVRQLLLYYIKMPLELRSMVKRLVFSFLKSLQLQVCQYDTKSIHIFTQLVPILFGIFTQSSIVGVESLVVVPDHFIQEYLEYFLKSYPSGHIVLVNIQRSITQLINTTLELDQSTSTQPITSILAFLTQAFAIPTGLPRPKLTQFVFGIFTQSLATFDRLLSLLTSSDNQIKTTSLQLLYTLESIGKTDNISSFWNFDRMEVLFDGLLDPIITDQSLLLIRLSNRHIVDPSSTLDSLFLRLVSHQHGENCTNNIVLLEEILLRNTHEITRILSLAQSNMFGLVQSPDSMTLSTKGYINQNLLILLQKLNSIVDLPAEIVSLATDTTHLYPESIQLLQYQLIASSMEKSKTDKMDIRNRLGSIVEGLTSANLSIRKLCLTILQEYIEMGIHSPLTSPSPTTTTNGHHNHSNNNGASPTNLTNDTLDNRKEFVLKYINHKIQSLKSNASDILPFLEEAINFIQLFSQHPTAL